MTKASGFLCFGPHEVGWSSLVARQPHKLKVMGSNPIPAIAVGLRGSETGDIWPSNSG